MSGDVTAAAVAIKAQSLATSRPPPSRIPRKPSHTSLPNIIPPSKSTATSTLTSKRKSSRTARAVANVNGQSASMIASQAPAAGLSLGAGGHHGVAELPILAAKSTDEGGGAAKIAAVLAELSATLFPSIDEQLAGLSPASKQAAAVRTNLRQLHSLGLLSDSELADFTQRSAPKCGQGDGGQLALITAAARAGADVSALLETGTNVSSGPTYRPTSLPLDGQTPNATGQQRGIHRKAQQVQGARRRLALTPPAAATATTFSMALADPCVGSPADALACGAGELTKPVLCQPLPATEDTAIIVDATSDYQVSPPPPPPPPPPPQLPAAEIRRSPRSTTSPMSPPKRRPPPVSPLAG